MVKHILMLRLKNYESKTQKLENALKLKKALEEMRGHIREIRHLEVGLNFNEKPGAFDLVLSASFDSEDDLEIYKMHPVHKKVLVFLRTVSEDTAVVDYEI
jgi:hypothetical protein